MSTKPEKKLWDTEDFMEYYQRFVNDMKIHVIRDVIHTNYEYEHEAMPVMFQGESHRVT